MASTFDQMFDSFCDPNKPVVVGLERVQHAVKAIKGGVVETPLTVSYSFTLKLLRRV